eukprot:3392551-Prymnesium_polylepis.1
MRLLTGDAGTVMWPAQGAIQLADGCGSNASRRSEANGVGCDVRRRMCVLLQRASAGGARWCALLPR